MEATKYEMCKSVLQEKMYIQFFFYVKSFSLNKGVKTKACLWENDVYYMEDA